MNRFGAALGLAGCGELMARFVELQGALNTALNHALNATALADIEHYCTMSFSEALRDGLMQCVPGAAEQDCAELLQSLASGLGIGALQSGLNALLLVDALRDLAPLINGAPEPSQDLLTSLPPFVACLVEQLWWLYRYSGLGAEWNNLFLHAHNNQWADINVVESRLKKDSWRAMALSVFLGINVSYKTELAPAWSVSGKGNLAQAYTDACIAYSLLAIRGCELPTYTAPIVGLADVDLEPHPGCVFAWSVWQSAPGATSASPESNKAVAAALLEQLRCGDWLP
jgi:hypothetical protein